MGLFDHNYRAWLPSDALGRGEFDDALDTALRSWSAKWFAGPSWQLSPGDRTDAGEWRWVVSVDGVAIGTTVDAGCSIAGAMLGAVPGQGFREANDRQAAASLADLCLADLRKRLSQLLKLSSDGDWREETCADFERSAAHRLLIGAPARGPCIHLVVTFDLLVAWIKARASGPPRPITLGTLDHGLSRQTVELSARVGGCALSLADLEGLGAGDVLVLDRQLDASLELAINGCPIDRRCLVDPAESRLALELVEPIVE